MSKTEAYICDYCGALVVYDECVGVSPLEDIFDKLQSYKAIMNPGKAEIHCCTTHFKDAYSRAAQQHNRRIDERGYTMKVNELSYDVRKTTIERHRANAIAKAAKKK